MFKKDDCLASPLKLNVKNFAFDGWKPMESEDVVADSIPFQSPQLWCCHLGQNMSDVPVILVEKVSSVAYFP
jgi:hypothetical protein